MNNSYGKNIDQPKSIALLRDGSPTAIEIFYDQFAPVVYGVILRIVKEEITAAELLKETFLYLLKNHSEFDESVQNLTQWVIGITRKIALQRISFLTYSRNHNSSNHVNHTETGGLFEQAQVLKTTFDMTVLMTTEERKVLDLVFFGGGSIKEVANHLGITEIKVKQLLQTAVNHHRKERREVWK